MRATTDIFYSSAVLVSMHAGLRRDCCTITSRSPVQEPRVELQARQSRFLDTLAPSVRNVKLLSMIAGRLHPVYMEPSWLLDAFVKAAAPLFLSRASYNFT